MFTRIARARLAVRRVRADESGATAVEYALVAAMIFLAIVGVLPLIGNNLQGVFQTVATGLK